MEQNPVELTDNCEKCGGETEVMDGHTGLRKCQECGNTFYRHHCWSCKETVDSRKDKTCRDCNWVICPKCGNCGMDCNLGSRRAYAWQKNKEK